MITDVRDFAAVTAPWRSDPDEVASALGTGPRGLPPEEADRRLAEVGPNRLAEPPGRPWWRVLADQLVNPLNLVLIVAAALAGAVERSYKEAVAIGVVLGLNGVLGFVQERRADQAVAALRAMLGPTAKARRAGLVVEVPAERLVPGDVVLVEAGDRVPADGRLTTSVNLEVDESGLTGESVPVAKSVAPVADVGLPDRTCMLHMSTTVTRGHAEMLVTGTGMGTEIGNVATLLEHTDTTRTPLQRQLDRLGVRLAYLAGAAVLLVAMTRLATGGGLGEVITLAVALGVAAIPEGLPAVVTVTLALGMRRMARRRAIVKRLTAVETLGATTVICTDKTGTLTLNQMTARTLWHAGRRYAVTGEGYGHDGTITADDGRPAGDLRDVLLPAILCNDAVVRDGVLVGDPTEGALLALAGKAGLDVQAVRAEAPRLAEIPFDSALKYMATFHRDGRVCVKGATDVLLRLATHVRLGTRDVPLDQWRRADVEDELHRMARRGERVLGVAVGRAPDAEPVLPAELVLVGLIGLLDPPRPEARAAIAECRTAGIDVKMITGDHLATASSIADALGITGQGVSGADLDRLDDHELDRTIEQTGVFARVAPEHKIRVVTALRRRGEVVAMTGDGVNDAPALKGADIGVAMGATGTDVAKEAAAMVLTDDNFATIVGAVRQGRAIYDNIVKFVRFQVGTNVAAILAMVAGSVFFLGDAVVLTPLMLLWINVIADGPPALALGLEPARPSVMREPPRPPGAHILTGARLARIAGIAAVMVAGTLLLFRYGLDRGTATAQTLAFTTFVLFQVVNILNVRDEHGSAFGPLLLHNLRLWAALAAVLVLQVCAVHVPLAQELFGTTALTPTDWLLAAATASLALWVEEVRKLVLRRRAAPAQLESTTRVRST
ncbi:cation-translocating P-type ATPase [Saccharothrix variisporea]|uniref:Ca2+-transporting ATPase n=1 Tax=Saccharothrix variisporea TaxID=543527 RepID=A0A495XLX0_9PSEU|nr:cation-transporting P-type ATPase [Saccharothrix variisporea]RKT74892.1 Ca2+-transporting ATPase [Saccharothrix variisporea]